ncbi:MAG TPA: hypothetical protein PLN53_10690 [Terricaulis sp.]|nr:hypothetical protein [Terricaulis sp.]
MRLILVVLGLLVTIEATISRSLLSKAMSHAAYAPDPTTGRTWEILYRGGDTRYITHGEAILHQWVFTIEPTLIFVGAAVVVIAIALRTARSRRGPDVE